MKNTLICFFVFFTVFCVHSQIITIPDSNFKAKLLAANSTNYIAKNISGNYASIDTNNDGEIQIAEAYLINYLDISNQNTDPSNLIISLEGIAAFNNLRVLNCSYNSISSINVNTLFGLEELRCEFNQIQALDISNLFLLKTLSCSYNQLSNLNVSNLQNLEILNCSFNFLTSLNLFGLTKITDLACSNNQINSLVLPGPLSQLRRFFCNDNQLTTLNLNLHYYLQTLNCNNNLITNLNINNHPFLMEVYCENNQLIELILFNLQNLNAVICSNNLLTSIDYSNVEFNYLNCSHNQITSLNLDTFYYLFFLDCSFNQLASLDVTQSNLLIELHCDNNLLTDLKIKNGITESELSFSNNPTLNNICADLPELTAVQTLVDTYGYVNCNVNADCIVLNTDDFTAKSTFTLFPNPANHTVTIKNATNYDISSVYIYSVLGQLIQEIPKEKTVESIDVSAYESGHYFVKITSNNTVETLSFIKN